MNMEQNNPLVVCSGLTKTYGVFTALDHLDLTLERGRFIGLLGPNGSGKTTLLKMIAGVLEPDAGTIKYGTHVSKTYYAQHQLEELTSGNTVFEEIDHVAPGWTISQVRTLLGAFLFNGDDVDKRVSVLSGGEKVRCMLSRMMLSGANVLMLDQPTNHLDLESIAALNNGLEAVKCNVLVSSHDHQLIQTVCNRVFDFTEDGRLIDRKLTYDEYLERQKEQQG